jgi:hypothetical protein
MKKFLFPLFVVAALASCTLLPHEKKSTETLTNLKQDVSTLASDEFEGRAIGTPGADKAAGYIQDQFLQIGLLPKGTLGFFQAFSFIPQGHGQVHQVGDSLKMGKSLVKEINGKNVVGYIDNGVANTIIIGAHYDHLGYGDENSLWTGEKAIHNGADDNASGVSAMIELARKFKADKSPSTNKYNYLFIAFSGEEKGLWGSNYFSKNPTVDLATVNCMMNMDMVGRLNAEHALSISGTGTSPEFETWLTQNNKTNFKLLFDKSGIGPSDHSSFYNMGVPVLHFFTGQHSDYHKPSDDFDKINYEGLNEVVNYMYAMCVEMNAHAKLEFTKTIDPKPMNSSFKVTLGVMPDYMFSGEGMRIDGVKENRPAAMAGLKQGDVVVRLGTNKITDMSSYMEALGKFNEGDTTEVEYIREGKSIVGPVIFK